MGRTGERGGGGSDWRGRELSFCLVVVVQRRGGWLGGSTAVCPAPQRLPLLLLGRLPDALNPCSTPPPPCSPPCSLLLNTQPHLRRRGRLLRRAVAPRLRRRPQPARPPRPHAARGGGAPRPRRGRAPAAGAQGQGDGGRPPGRARGVAPEGLGQHARGRDGRHRVGPRVGGVAQGAQAHRAHR